LMMRCAVVCIFDVAFHLCQLSCNHFTSISCGKCLCVLSASCLVYCTSMLARACRRRSPCC
jgi:hypothetical protein